MIACVEKVVYSNNLYYAMFTLKLHFVLFFAHCLQFHSLVCQIL